MITIIRLDNSHKGKTFNVSYRTDYFYKAEVKENDSTTAITFTKTKYSETVVKGYEFQLMRDWFEDPLLFAAIKRDEELGYIEMTHEKWNNRLRITNIFIFEEYRQQGIGTLLIERAASTARELKARALILETQSCNYPAICFYRKAGFNITGCDLTAYSNEDIQHGGVRLEMVRTANLL